METLWLKNTDEEDMRYHSRIRIGRFGSPGYQKNRPIIQPGKTQQPSHYLGGGTNVIAMPATESLLTAKGEETKRKMERR